MDSEQARAHAERFFTRKPEKAEACETAPQTLAFWDLVLPLVNWWFCC
jgi:hypothetical protein